jgi:endonuclease/exonuclease/phosphatase family metal-dependent hydrolase
MRLCALNVHTWADARGRSNVQAVIEFLRELDCDVVTLHEVLREGETLARVADALEMQHAFGAAAWLGNAILARHPLRAAATTPGPAGYEEGRCVLAATVLSPDGSLDVCATHLDPRYEDTRLEELDLLLAAADARAPEHVLMGDFNALRLADYPPAALAQVRAMRAANDKEEPRGEVIARLDARGYLDAFRLARAGGRAGYAAALVAPPPEGAPVTCWAGTRVDYVWATEALLARFALRAATHVPTAASDHAAVVIDLAPR